MLPPEECPRCGQENTIYDWKDRRTRWNCRRCGAGLPATLKQVRDRVFIRVAATCTIVTGVAMAIVFGLHGKPDDRPWEDRPLRIIGRWSIEGFYSPEQVRLAQIGLGLGLVIGLVLGLVLGRYVIPLALWRLRHRPKE
jgi:hypothetical protein